MSAETTRRPSPGASAIADPTRVLSGQASEVELLERRLDDLAQQVLGARDAALGAEAELGVARGRIADLERRLDVLTVENEELRAVIDGGQARDLVAAFRDLGRGTAKQVKRRLGS